MSEQSQYGFRVDPMTWINESDSVQAAQVRALLLKTPKDGDEAILSAEVERILADQNPDGSLGDHNTTGKLIRLSRLGCDPNRPEVKTAVEFICSDEELGDDGILGGYAVYVVDWAGYHDAELIARSTRRHASQVMTMDFFSLCPWGGQVCTRGMWSGRSHADITPALDRGMNVLLQSVQPGKGWQGFLDPFGYLDAAGVIDHPLSRQIVIKQIPMILRTQQADGTWGGDKHLGYGPDNATYIVLRALIKHDLLDELRTAPPLPPDWQIVRAIPAPEGELSMLTVGGGRLWFYDKATEEAVGLSPEDGEELTRTKLPSDVRNIAWREGKLAVIRVKEFVEDDWDIEELVLVDVDGDGSAHEAPTSEWPGTTWHVYDFEEGPPVLRGGPHGEWGEAPFGLHTAGVTSDGDDLWVLDSETNRLCLIAKTDSGRALTALPAPDSAHVKMSVARPKATYDIPLLDGATSGDDWVDRGFRVNVFHQLGRGAVHFRGDSIGMFRPMRTGMALAWTNDGLLLRLEVDDDQPVEADTDQDLWENNGDCVLLYVAPNRGESGVRRVVIAPGMTDDQPDVRALVNDSLTPPEDPANETFHRVNADADSAVRVARTKTNGGYALEVFVTWQDLKIEPAAGDEIGVQVILLDRDSTDPNAPMIGAFWYPGLATRKNTSQTHPIRLSETASPAVAALVEGGAPDGLYDLAVTANGDLAGQTVTVLDGENTLAEVVLMTDEHSGYAIGSIPLPLPAPKTPLAQPRVMLAGECIAQLQIDRPIPDKEMPIELVRDGNSAMLTGMETMDWGGSFFGRQDSYVAVFREVARAAGHDVSFAEVMGLSGAAFNLHMQKPWCPSSFVTGAGKAYEHPQEVFGLELEMIGLNEGKDAEGIARLREAVVERIDAGLPVIYMDGEFSLIVGYRDDAESYICKPYPGGPPAYTEMDFPTSFLGPAWYALAPQKAAEPMDRREAIVESLRIAIELAEMPAPDEGGDAYGFVAYEWWIEGLRNPPEEVNLHANAYGYAILLTSRQAAADYLRLIAEEVKPEAAKHLLVAAEKYAGVAKRMYDGRECVEHPWDENWTPENRTIEADIMAANLADERIAIEEIKQALAAMGIALDAAAHGAYTSQEAPEMAD
ncbi:MAG: DOMON domain-containing protein [Planctomycetota bacterium]